MLKKSTITLRRLPGIHFASTYRVDSHCQTLSNAFNMSRKTAVVSRPSSKD